MIYGKYKNVRNAVWQLIVDLKIDKLPIKVNKIAKQLDIVILKNSAVKILKQGESGIAILQGTQFYIVYDDSMSSERCRFTVAHELGHILLGHLMTHKTKYRTFVKRNEEEQAADMFAARLLAPACILHEIQALTAEQIQEVCNISYTAAKIRAERMQMLEQRNMFYLHPLEIQVQQQFDSYIKKYRNQNGHSDCGETKNRPSKIYLSHIL